MLVAVDLFVILSYNIINEIKIERAAPCSSNEGHFGKKASRPLKDRRMFSDVLCKRSFSMIRVLWFRNESFGEGEKHE